MNQQITITVCAPLVALGIVTLFLPADAMTLDECRRAHVGYCAYRVVNRVRDWEPMPRARHYQGEVVMPLVEKRTVQQDGIFLAKSQQFSPPVPVRRLHAVLHDADPTRWGSPPPPPPDRFTDRHDSIADRINAVDWNMGR